MVFLLLVTVHCQWIPFESPYIVDDIFSGRVAAAGDRVWILADGKEGIEWDCQDRL